MEQQTVVNCWVPEDSKMILAIKGDSTRPRLSSSLKELYYGYVGGSTLRSHSSESSDINT